jgi:hypothetical protein
MGFQCLLEVIFYEVEKNSTGLALEMIILFYILLSLCLWFHLKLSIEINDFWVGTKGAVNYERSEWV